MEHPPSRPRPHPSAPGLGAGAEPGRSPAADVPRAAAGGGETGGARTEHGSTAFGRWFWFWDRMGYDGMTGWEDVI